MDTVVANENEEIVGEIQQEIITDIIDGNETVIAVYTVQGGEDSCQNGPESITDLSALATVAEFVPTLQEVEKTENVDNEKVTLTNEQSVQNNEISEEEPLNCLEVENEDSYNDLNQSTTTPGEYFVTTTYEEMMAIIHDYFERTSSRFVVQKRTKDFGITGSNYNLNKHRIQWEDTKNANLAYEYNFLPFDGVPHITVGHYVMHCQFGNDSSAAQKEKRRLLREKDEIPKQKRNLKYPTKKCGCPAKIYVKQVLKFPQFKIMKKTERRKRTGAARLKEQFNLDRSQVQTEVFFMGRLPVIAEHQFHELMQGREFSKESVHKDLIIKAQELYFKKKSLNEITSYLEAYVTDQLFYKQEPPDRKRRKYFPSRKDLRNFIGRIRQLERFTNEEKEQINEMVLNIRNEQKNFHVSFETESESKPLDANLQMDSSDEDYYNSEEKHINVSTTNENTQKKKLSERHEVQTFLFCYQTPEQQRLLKRYGSATFLLEIHHNSSVKRALTYKMFALLVQTNVDFQVVGSIIYSKQRKDGLKDGLSTIKDWNVWWIPKYFLIDCTEEVADAYDQVFQNTPSFLNIHSCEKAWLEFLSTPSNELRDSDDIILDFLKNMAYSFSENSLSLAASLLEESSIWHTSVKLRTWFQAEWLPTAKKWVAGYRPEDLFIFDHLKHDLPSCIKCYEDLLSDSTKQNGGLIGLLQTLHQIVSKEEYAKYIQRNISQYETGKHFKIDECLSESLAGVPSFILPKLYAKAKEALKCNFAIAEGNQLGLFVVSRLATKQINETVEMVVPSYDQKTVTHETSSSSQQQQQQQEITDSDATTLENCLINAINFAANLQLQGENVTNLSLLPSQSGAPSGVGDVVDSKQQQDIPISSANVEEQIEIGEGEEYTVSFGDMNSYPFCTCTHWQHYKMPCAHMFTIFQNIPGWNYDILSPVYRMNYVLHVDHSCVSFHREDNRMFKEKSCQTIKTHPTMIEAQTQKNNIGNGIFFPMNSLKVSESLHTKATDLLFHLNKSAFLFKDVLIYKKLRSQLTDIVRATHQRLVNRQIEQELDGKVLSSKMLLPKPLTGNESFLANPAERNITKPMKVKVALNQAPQSELTRMDMIHIEEVNKLLKAIAESNETFVKPIDTSQITKTRTKCADELAPQGECPGGNAGISVSVQHHHDGNENEGASAVTETVESKLEEKIATIPCEKLTFLEPIIQPGTKRDASHFLQDSSNADKTKVSILEYLPLLKQKCVLPEDFDKDQKISLEMLANKLNVTIEQANNVHRKMHTAEIIENVTTNSHSRLSAHNVESPTIAIVEK